MMNKQTQEALEMAIEAMDRIILQVPLHNKNQKHPILEALQACKEALEPAQESQQESETSSQPVAIVETHYGFTDAIVTFLTENNEQLPIGTLLYTHPKEWQGLSDAVVMEIVWDLEHITDKDLFVVEYYRAIEQALKEKNHG